MNYLIGCGGVGSWLLPPLIKLVGKSEITVVDRDSLEESNLDRQQYDGSFIGRIKSSAMSEKYDVEPIQEYYYLGLIEHSSDDWLLCCADNHAARVACLQACDRWECRCICACNETWSAEAFFYQRDWQNGNKDPRVYYPEMLDNHAGDPLARAAGCTGDAALSANPQGVSANFMAAALALHLYAVWNYCKLTPDARGYIPHRLNSNKTKLSSLCAAD